MVIEPVRQLNIHPFEVLLTGARNAGVANGLQDYIKSLEQQASSEGDCQVTEITNFWAAGKKSGLEGADTVKAELLPQLEQLKQQVSGLENTLHNEEEQHNMEVVVMRRDVRR
ncbi:hypothetical protein PILCRDRAFT_92435 [Piloderma croceum F 1598]|uniref:Uncharacterized protein n=1 Tax=Piloderma croceum (strain F 1598) TaxID=765440 RepID=A0A0C3F4M5_PILCF|nr:hypothetical protein PILCRDRAFT_92435 [Piloderma croceum F 1598]